MKTKRRILHKDLQKLGVLPWESWKTTKRKIEKENFPAYCESGHYYFDVQEIEMWFKKRKIISAA